MRSWAMGRMHTMHMGGVNRGRAKLRAPQTPRRPRRAGFLGSCPAADCVEEQPRGAKGVAGDQALLLGYELIQLWVIKSTTLRE